MKLLKVGLSGVRGIVGEALTPELVMDFAAAFGTRLGGGRVLVGRDTRPSGPMLHAAVLAALASTGCNVVDIGVCPSPILQFLVPRLRARGGVSITAGHNDAAWNALAFINREGASLNGFQGREVLDLYHLGRFRKARGARLGAVRPLGDYRGRYFDALAGYLDARAIAAAGLKVAIDPGNGAGAGFVDDFCRRLGVELVAVNDEPSGYFPHDPEPRPRNAGELASLVRVAGADAGFLLNSDVSRVSIVAEDGETLSEEYTLPIAAGRGLEREPGAVVTNLSTSRMIEDVAARAGRRVVKAPVGQSHIIQKLLVEEAGFAGEGSGSVAARSFHPAFDGFLAMGLVLEALAVGGRKISDIVAGLPRYHIVKEKIPCPPAKVHSVVAEARRLFGRDEITLVDGVRADWKDGWVHVRASATEPMIRVIAENVSREKAQADLDRVVRAVGEFI